MFGSIYFLMGAPSRREEHIETIGPEPAQRGNGPLGSNGMSSGLVQGTLPCHSTARIVFDMPSVICSNVVGLGVLAAGHPGTAQSGRLAGEDVIRRVRSARRPAVGAGHAVDRRHLVDQLAVVGAVPGLVEMILAIEGSCSRYGRIATRQL